MDNRIYSKMFILACLVGAIVVGSVLPDIDHILPPYTRSWGHNLMYPALLTGLVLTYLCGCIIIRLLRKRECV